MYSSLLWFFLFQHYSTYPILKILHKKRCYRNIKRYPYHLTPSKWECCTWNQAPSKGRSPPPYDLWTSGSTSFSNIPASLTRKIRVDGSRGWREVKCCVESSKMLALMSPIEGTFEFGTKNSGTTSHLWKKHTQMSVTLKVQTCESWYFLLPSFTNFTMSHVILGVFQNSGTSVCLCLHLVWILLAPRLGFFLKVPSFKRNWFEAMAYRSRVFTQQFQSNLGWLIDHF